MKDEKLLKSLKTVHTIIKIMKVFCIIAAVLIAIVTLALPSFGDIIVQVIEMSLRESGEYVDPAVMAELAAVKDSLVKVLMAAGVTSVVSLVITFMYTKKGEILVKNMREKSLFAKGYGQEMRSIGKLMVTEVAVSTVLMMVLIFILAPDFTGSSFSININLLITSSFVYLASYLMDHAYEASVRNEVPAEPEAVYIEPMIGDGREE